MNTQLTTIAPKLQKLLLMLSSEQPGEVVSAACAIGRTLQSIGADWHDLVAGLLVGPVSNSDGADWSAMREYCLRHQDRLRPREVEFLNNIGDWRGDLTEKQFKWLASIHARLCQPSWASPPNNGKGDGAHSP
jgi:hypothetical protein